MIDAIEIGYAIKDRRATLGLTQAQLAEAAGISKRCLWSLELGQNSGVQLDKLTAVLEALGLDLTISAVDLAEPIEALAGAAGTTPPSAPSESRMATIATANSTDAANASGTNASSTNASSTIDALAILTGGLQ